MWSAVQCALEGRILKRMKRLVSVALIFAALASPLGRLGAQEPSLAYGFRFRCAGFIAATAAATGSSRRCHHSGR